LREEVAHWFDGSSVLADALGAVPEEIWRDPLNE
jgi:lambda repressor-like predicted transcriptional regulator